MQSILYKGIKPLSEKSVFYLSVNS